MFNPSDFTYRTTLTNAARLEAEAKRLNHLAKDTRYSATARADMLITAGENAAQAVLLRANASHYEANGYHPVTRYKHAA